MHAMIGSAHTMAILIPSCWPDGFWTQATDPSKPNWDMNINAFKRPYVSIEFCIRMPMPFLHASDGFICRPYDTTLNPNSMYHRCVAWIWIRRSVPATLSFTTPGNNQLCSPPTWLQAELLSPRYPDDYLEASSDL